MIKVFCDICGNEVVKKLLKGITQEHLDPIIINLEKYHLCPKHYNEFIEWRNKLKRNAEDQS